MELSTASRGPQLILVNAILYAIATLAVGLRFFARAKIIRKIGADDWWMLASWVRTSLFDKIIFVLIRDCNSCSEQGNLSFGLSVSVLVEGSIPSLAN